MKNLIEQIQKGKANGALSTIEGELKKRIMAAVVEERKRVASLVFDEVTEDVKPKGSTHKTITDAGWHHTGSDSYGKTKTHRYEHPQYGHLATIHGDGPTEYFYHDHEHNQTTHNGRTGDKEFPLHQFLKGVELLHSRKKTNEAIDAAWNSTTNEPLSEAQYTDHALAHELAAQAIHNHEAFHRGDHDARHGGWAQHDLHTWAKNYKKKQAKGVYDREKAVKGLTHAIKNSESSYFGKKHGEKHGQRISGATRTAAARHLLPHVEALMKGKHIHDIDESKILAPWAIKEASPAMAPARPTAAPPQAPKHMMSPEEREKARKAKAKADWNSDVRMPWPKPESRNRSAISGFSESEEHPHAQAYRDWLGRKAFWRQSKKMSSNGGYRLRTGNGKSEKAPWSDSVKKTHKDESGKHNTAVFHKAAREWAAQHEPHLNPGH